MIFQKYKIFSSANTRTILLGLAAAQIQRADSAYGSIAQIQCTDPTYGSIAQIQRMDPAHGFSAQIRRMNSARGPGRQILQKQKYFAEHVSVE